ncbi:MAG: hypothetical protein DRN17_05360 [Thermoplasmata archaeon]|nr:MAG: hypothetical protein DRN17_05360 [Thermoplasmata archaeon]
MQILMNEEKVNGHINENDGFCIECGEISYGGVEPDAMNYLCEECGEKKVVGMETAILYGWVVPTEEKYPTLKGVSS